MHTTGLIGLRNGPFLSMRVVSTPTFFEQVKKMHSPPAAFFQSFAYFFRRFSILVRLLIGFSIALAPLFAGLMLVHLKISELRTELSAGKLNDTLDLASRVEGIQSDMWLALAGTVCIGVLLIVAITISIVRPIGVLKSSTQSVANGDLTETLDTQWTDEVGEMTRSLSGMRAALAGVVVTIHHSAHTVSSASNELAVGNARLSQRTETSAANLEETASAMEEIQAMARRSADAARRVSQLTKETVLSANRSGRSLSDGVHTMEKLSASSQKMADIVGVIDAIAFQTNILALNAAVEAARAGEQGRGFAVVASEVRALASRSAASAKEIKDLIQTTIEQTKESARSVEEAGTEMRRLVENVSSVTDHIAEISNAADEQSSGIDMVSQSVAELDAVTHQNAALVEQAAQASNGLQNEARRLVQAVSVFRLSANAAA